MSHHSSTTQAPRAWIDLTNAPHVTVFAPIIQELEHRGFAVDITARDFTQTIELCRLHDLDVTVIGRHGGAGRLGKARAAMRRTRALTKFGKQHGPYDIALSHGSTDLPIATRRLKIPHVTMFDYEWAATMHRLNCRLSWKVVTPAAIPPDRLYPYGAAGKLMQYEGCKESYVLSDIELDPTIRSNLGVAEDAVMVVVRPAPALALYHRGVSEDRFFTALASMLDERSVQVVALPRTDDQRHDLGRYAAEHDLGTRLIIPDAALHGPSLVAAADLVMSAGGTMNREAAVLGTPVITALSAQPAAVDAALIAAGLMHELTDELLDKIDWTDLSSLAPGGNAEAFRPRPVGDLVDLLLSGLPAVQDNWPSTAQIR